MDTYSATWLLEYSVPVCVRQGLVTEDGAEPFLGELGVTPFGKQFPC